MKLRSLSIPILVLAAILTLGCGGEKPAAKDDHDHAGETAAEHAGHEHGGWWCAEHGVPEDICALCNSKVAADFQKKGDWCKQHDRPDSQCFLCHPELEAKFAQQYEAREGKKPPERKG
jgi:hypothetical protein